MALVKKLRDWKYGDGNSPAARRLRLEAADHIEALEAQLAERDKVLTLADKIIMGWANSEDPLVLVDEWVALRGTGDADNTTAS